MRRLGIVDIVIIIGVMAGLLVVSLACGQAWSAAIAPPTPPPGWLPVSAPLPAQDWEFSTHAFTSYTGTTTLSEVGAWYTAALGRTPEDLTWDLDGRAFNFTATHTTLNGRVLITVTALQAPDTRAPLWVLLRAASVPEE